VTKQRGVPVESELAPNVLATVHPSSILRAPDEAARREAYEAFVADLQVVRQFLDG
jgi:uracil-DNA glycosylase